MLQVAGAKPSRMWAVTRNNLKRIDTAARLVRVATPFFVAADYELPLSLPVLEPAGVETEPIERC